MYTSFYNLREKPFNLTPSPRFIYLGESHKEALALLKYGIMERKGFILLTGEVGTGKTTIVQALLQGIGKSVQVVYLSNPLMDAHDFINYIGFRALGRTEHYKSKTEFLLEFEAYLKTCRRDQKNFVLIIDESQSLSFPILEEIRLLSNMESAEEKLINIFLVGQPELNNKLSDLRCRPLLQRISIRHHISPLSLLEARDYINTRLETAGAKDPNEIFSKEVIKALHQYSNGFPRMINVLADNSLLLGYSRGTRKITSAMVEESYRELQLEGSVLKANQEKPGKGQDDAKLVVQKTPGWKWALAGFLLGVVIAAFLLTQFRQTWLDRIAATRAGSKQISSPRQDEENLVVRQKLPDPVDLQNVKRNETLLTPDTAPSDSSLVPEVERSETPLTPDAPVGRRESRPTPFPQAVESPAPNLSPKVERSETLLTPNASAVSGLSPDTPTIAIVKEGDSLSKLAAGVYGRFDRRILKLILEHNPDLVDVNQIAAGQKIVFPPGVPSESSQER